MRPAVELFKEALARSGFREEKGVLVAETPEAVYMVRPYEEAPENTVDFFFEVTTRDGKVAVKGRCIGKPDGTAECTTTVKGDEKAVRELLKPLVEKASAAAKIWAWVYGPEYYVARVKPLMEEVAERA